jgi:hypothetical protein
MHHPPTTVSRTEDDLAQLLASPPVRPSGEVGGDALLLAARSHGIVPLLSAGLAAHGDVPGAPSMPELTRIARGEALNVAVQDVVLERALAALRDAEIPALVLKGGALAQTHYSNPHLRPRIDTDVLVPPRDYERAIAALERSGFERLASLDSSLLLRQAPLVLRQPNGLQGIIDLHREISNRPAYLGVLAFDQLLADCQTVPFGEHGFQAPGDVHALILACVHLLGHHGNAPRLIWLYDIVALAELLDVAGLKDARSLADARGCAPAVAHTLAQAYGVLGTLGSRPVSQFVAAWAAQVPQPPAEPTRLRIVVNDIRALPGISLKCAYIWQNLFPGASYMRATARPGVSGWLPSLYARRLGRVISALLSAK